MNVWSGITPTLTSRPPCKQATCTTLSHGSRNDLGARKLVLSCDACGSSAMARGSCLQQPECEPHPPKMPRSSTPARQPTRRTTPRPNPLTATPPCASLKMTANLADKLLTSLRVHVTLAPCELGRPPLRKRACFAESSKWVGMRKSPRRQPIPAFVRECARAPTHRERTRPSSPRCYNTPMKPNNARKVFSFPAHCGFEATAPPEKRRGAGNHARRLAGNMGCHAQRRSRATPREPLNMEKHGKHGKRPTWPPTTAPRAVVEIHRCFGPRNEDLGPIRGAVGASGVLPIFAGDADPCGPRHEARGRANPQKCACSTSDPQSSRQPGITRTTL